MSIGYEHILKAAAMGELRSLLYIFKMNEWFGVGIRNSKGSALTSHFYKRFRAYLLSFLHSLRDRIVLAEGAMKIAPKKSNRKNGAAWIKVVKGFFFNWIHSEARGAAIIGERQLATLVKTYPTNTGSPLRYLTAMRT